MGNEPGVAPVEKHGYASISAHGDVLLADPQRLPAKGGKDLWPVQPASKSLQFVSSSAALELSLTGVDSCQKPQPVFTQSPAFISNMASCISRNWLAAITVLPGDFQSGAAKSIGPWRSL